MDARFYKDINKFIEVSYDFLIEKEAENNLIFGLLNKLKDNPYVYGEEYPILTAIFKDDKVNLISIRTPPFNQLISYTDNMNSIDTLVDALNERNYILPGVLGCKEAAAKFVKLWAKVNGLKFRLVMNERIYKLTHVNESTLGNKNFMGVSQVYNELILQWVKEFILETFSESQQETERSLNSMDRIKVDIKNKKFYLLMENSEPLSMVKEAMKTPNGASINNVYTPPHLRRRGYATECVAKLSKKLLKEGNKFCFLFTDLMNPTSNSIYQKVGYRSVIDVDLYEFIKE
jgi:ribosomal protein S18 acetylase RimI-like enzyme